LDDHTGNGAVPSWRVGCQNSALASEQRF